jgi:hypothetical protein
MTDQPVKQETSSRPLFLQPIPGYWRTKRKLERLKLLRDLIRHRENWAGQIALAKPLSELLPCVPENLRAIRIKEEIEMVLRLAYWDLEYAAVPTGVYYGKRGEPEDEQRSFNVILDYFRLPREPGKEHYAFEATTGSLTEGIGIYEARKHQAFWEMFNPVVWVAYIIRLPITVMERAGLVGHEKTQDMVLSGYTLAIRLMMAALVGLFLVRQGVQFPWKAFFDRVIGK